MGKNNRWVLLNTSRFYQNHCLEYSQILTLFYSLPLTVQIKFLLCNKTYLVKIICSNVSLDQRTEIILIAWWQMYPHDLICSIQALLKTGLKSHGLKRNDYNCSTISSKLIDQCFHFQNRNIFSFILICRFVLWELKIIDSEVMGSEIRYAVYHFTWKMADVIMFFFVRDKLLWWHRCVIIEGRLIISGGSTP